MVIRQLVTYAFCMVWHVLYVRTVDATYSVDATYNMCVWRCAYENHRNHLAVNIIYGSFHYEITIIGLYILGIIGSRCLKL